MFQHSLLLAYRSFKRFKSSFFINLVGLSTGLACALLIYLWVRDELSIDKFHQKDSQLFQVMENRKTTEGISTNDKTAGLLAETLIKQLPEVEYALSARLREETKTLSVGEKTIKGRVLYAGGDFFKAFSYPLIEGDKNGVLKDKSSVVVSKELAMNLFNSTQNIIGKTLELQHEKRYLISGIFEDIPTNSSMQFDFVLSFDEYKEINPNVLDWHYNSAASYVVLKQGTNINHVNEKIKELIKEKTGESDRSLFLTSFSNNYLYGNYVNGLQAEGRIEYVKLFSMIAVFILLIASINFMNLSTAKAASRMKEVGVKKAVGASRIALILQYMSESMFMALLSLLLAIIFVVLLLPEFNDITGKPLSLSFDPGLVLSLLGITCLTGLMSGSYPALYLSGFNPAMVLKGKLHRSVNEMWARKGLVVFQFTLSVIFIVSVLVIYKQINYVRSTHLGYSKDNIIYFEMEGNLKEKQESFLSQIKSMPGIVNASSIGANIVGSGLNTIMALNWEGKNPDDKIVFEMRPVNYEMMEMLDIEMKEGRTFSRDFGADSTKIIFNEKAIEVMGLTDPVGKVIKIYDMPFEIVGVTNNFHFASFHENVKPLFFILRPTWTQLMMAKIEAGKERETLSRLEQVYQRFNPGFVFEYKFLDEQYQAQYAAEQRVATLSGYFAGLAILISCLGLFGLASFTAQRRRKEIGIRKVLGSSEMSIVYLLSGEFTKIVLLSIVIALPISYLLATQWLENFAYSIDLKWWYFIGAGLLAMMITWFTVGMQAIKAARVNPIQTLRDE